MRQAQFTYYKLLGVEPTATTLEIIKAYKQKSLEYHPDKNQGSKTAKKLFQFVGEGKVLLTNPAKRLAYDYQIGVKKRPRPKPQKILIPVRIHDNSLIGIYVVSSVLAGLMVGFFLGLGRK